VDLSGCASRISVSRRVRKAMSGRGCFFDGMARILCVSNRFSGFSRDTYRKKEWRAASRRFLVETEHFLSVSIQSRNATTESRVSMDMRNRSGRTTFSFSQYRSSRRKVSLYAATVWALVPSPLGRWEVRNDDKYRAKSFSGFFICISFFGDDVSVSALQPGDDLRVQVDGQPQVVFRATEIDMTQIGGQIGQQIGQIMAAQNP